MISYMMLKKEIMKNKKTILQIIIMCCFIWIITWEVLPNRVTYDVKELEDYWYLVSVTDRHGETIYTERLYSPAVAEIGKNTIAVIRGKGDWLQYQFINGKTGEVSEWISDVWECNEKLAVYAKYEEGDIKIVIRDLYKDKVYKEIVDDFAPIAVPKYVIKDAQVINNHLVYLKYYVGDSYAELEEKDKLVFVF